jgi:hypothetical protein
MKKILLALLFLGGCEHYIKPPQYVIDDCDRTARYEAVTHHKMFGTGLVLCVDKLKYIQCICDVTLQKY